MKSQRFNRLYTSAQIRTADACLSRAAIGRRPSRRAAGMLEYVLLGAMAALIIGGVLSGGISGIIDRLMDRISDFTD